VSGTIPGSPGIGLGPRFNLDGCAGCHAFPAAGGSSPPNNPQVQVAAASGATNTLPGFIKPNGPVRVARFIKNSDGTADGRVHDLFTITGRSDAVGCVLAQPDFAAQRAAGNVIFRIPTPVFGDGLVEAVPDANLLASVASNATERATFGVSGHFNRDPADNTITRFGWKAQHKSLLAFAGEAAFVEEGVTNDIKPTNPTETGGCAFNQGPEDAQPTTPRAGDASSASASSAAIVNQAEFMRLSAPPARGPSNPQVVQGQALFSSVGCDSCHITSQTTAAVTLTGGETVSFQPFSDFAVHNMGSGLADHITQGSATGREWRSAPLWGLGQRLFFLHDGRAPDLVTAIEAHASSGSEANLSIDSYNALSPAEQQAVLVFLRSL
jgi:CxxC motif-containing protein (DUF1111 family)